MPSTSPRLALRSARGLGASRPSVRRRCALRFQLGIWGLVTLGAALTACGPKAEEETPERVVEQFIDHMERVHGDPKVARGAYDLLWSDAQRVLTERAKRASGVTGRRLGPEEMIVPSRFSLTFKPTRYRSRVEGLRAVVSVTGSNPGERFDVHCAREDDRWRVVLDIPEPAPVRTRKQAD